MRTVSRLIAVGVATVGLLGFSASAATAGPLEALDSLTGGSDAPFDGFTVDAKVLLERAPAPDQLITGITQLAGKATAPEGVTNVRLFVVQHNASLADASPVASRWLEWPQGELAFDFSWDSASTPNGLYDLVVLTGTPMGREARAEVLGVKIQRIAKIVNPAKKPATKSSTKVTAPSEGVVTGDARQVTPLARTGSAPKVAVPLPVLPSEEVSQAVSSQEDAFYEAYASLPYTTPASDSVSGEFIAGASDTVRGLWPSIAASLVLLLSAAHIQRVLRQQKLFG
jgi:hypothetical protein